MKHISERKYDGLRIAGILHDPAPDAQQRERRVYHLLLAHISRSDLDRFGVVLGPRS